MQASPEALFLRHRSTGQPEPLGELFDRVSPQLLALALHLCNHPADAEDALQATFVVAIDRAASWDQARPLLPWLGGILSKQCKRIGERRARRREQELPPEPLVLEDGSPLATTERRELVARLRAHVDRLPVEQRQVLLLQLEHGLAPAEVAEVLAVPPGTVRMRLHRAVQTLRGVLPAGLVALLVAALPSRGVAAVRGAVLAHAGTVGVGGAFAAKNLAWLLALAAMLLGALGVARPWSWSVGEAPDEGVPVARAGEAATAPAVPPGHSPEPLAAERTAVAPLGPAVPATDELGTLRVRVVRADDGTPLPSLPVRIACVSSDVEFRFAGRTAATDGRGECVVADLAPGAVRVLAGDEVVLADIGAAQATSVIVRVAAAHARLERVFGRVVLAEGGPAPFAQVVVGPRYQGVAEPVAACDGDGRFDLQLCVHELALGARLAGHAPSVLRHVDRGGEEVVLVLPSLGAELSGELVDSEGHAVAGAQVLVGRPRRRAVVAALDGEEPPAHRLGVAGSDGKFVFEDLPSGEFELLVRANGFAPCQDYVELRAGERRQSRFTLSAGQAVRGVVVDQDGLPVAGVDVHLGGSYGEHRRTDREGRFAYRHATPGLQQLRVSGEEIVAQSLERAVADVTEWRVVVRRAQRYIFRLVDDLQEPVVGWGLQLQSEVVRTGVSDVDGRVVLWTVGAGPFLLAGTPPDAQRPIVPLAWPASAVPDIETTLLLRRRDLPAGVLTGEVVDAAGAAVTGLVEVRSPAGDVWLSCPCTGGRFRIEGVPAGHCKLAVGHGDLAAGLPLPTVLVVPVPGLRPREHRELGRLRLPPEGALQVRVRAADGRPVPTANVFLFDAAGDEHIAAADGKVRSWPVGAFRWQVYEDDAQWRSGALEVPAGGTASLDIVLQPGVRRQLRFPVPRPDWGAPSRVDYALYAPDGSIFERGEFDPREEMPYQFKPGLGVGTWRLELVLADGRRFAGGFTIDTLQPTLASIDVAVTPAR